MLSRKALVLVAVIAALAMCGARMARAGDYYGYNKAPAYYAPPVFAWSGFYVGAHGGLSFTGMPNPFAGRNGLAAGLQAGYLRQIGVAVVGAEIEGSYLGSTEHKVFGGTLEETWRGALKARGGLTFDQTLLYGTAGLALTKFAPTDGLSGSSAWKSGYLLGGGIEQGFGGGLSARVEYNYINTPDVKSTSAFGTQRTDVDSHALKAGINYRF